MGKDHIEPTKKFFLDCLLRLIKSIASIYDFVTLPFYYYNQRVKTLKEDVESVRSQQVDPTDPSSPWRQVNLEPIADMVNSHVDSFDTYDQMLERSLQVYADRPCYGYRKILEERVSKKPDTGKIIKQVRLDDYRWVTFGEFSEQIEAAKKGFLLNGIKSGMTVMLFADTRPEWQIASQALLRMNVTVGTMYSTLGTDGIVHSINETEVTHIITQEDIVDKLLVLRDRLPTLKTIIYFEHNYKGIRSKSPKVRAGLSFVPSSETKKSTSKANGLSNKFFNRALFLSNNNKSDANYTLLNGHNDITIHTKNDEQSCQDNKTKHTYKNTNDDELAVTTEINSHQQFEKNGNIITETTTTTAQHDLKGIISVKSNSTTSKVSSIVTNGHATNINSNPKTSTLSFNPTTTSGENCESESDKKINHVNSNNINEITNDDIDNKCAAKQQENGLSKQLLATSDDSDNNLKHKLTCIPFSYLLHLGRVVDDDKVPSFQRPKKGNVAVIMYTSGSTGVPKGVVITHTNMLATVKSFSYTTKEFLHDYSNNCVAAYLPLAHIFEFCIESMMLFHGVKFGFASPHTLTDKSPGLLPGEKGDLFLLKPSILIIVPLILDRIVQGVKGVLHSEGYFKEQLVTWLIEYKIYWSKYYYKTPLIDRLVCKKIGAALGGRCRYVICGSAPLSPETQQFVRNALNLKLPQGFGTTETCASTTCQLFDDQSTGNVGLPVAGAFIKLESWHEGDYHPTDKPHPRGEIVVGGDMIAQGYYKLDEQTKEAFYEDDDGMRWYRTGDIGLMLPNGQLKIIDRKKDLVKLQNGEYISLGKVESSLKCNKYLENFCAHANPNYNFIVALGPVNELALVELGESILKERLSSNNNTSGMDRNGINSSKIIRNSTSEECNKLMHDSSLEAIRRLEEIMTEYRANKKNIRRPSVRSNDTNNNLNDNNNTKNNSTSEADAISVAVDEPESQASHHYKLLSRLCNNKLVEEAVYQTILSKSKESNLLRLEIPRKVILLPDEWTAETGLVTAALKIRRAFIYKRYESTLEELYKQSSQK